MHRVHTRHRMHPRLCVHTCHRVHSRLCVYTCHHVHSRLCVHTPSHAHTSSRIEVRNNCNARMICNWWSSNDLFRWVVLEPKWTKRVSNRPQIRPRHKCNRINLSHRYQFYTLTRDHRNSIMDPSLLKPLEIDCSKRREIRINFWSRVKPFLEWWWYSLWVKALYRPHCRPIAIL